MTEDRADRTIRAAAAVVAAVDFLMVGERYCRCLTVHRPDGALCVSCGERWPCSIAGLAIVARDRVEDTRRAAAEQAPRKPVKGRGAVRRWLGPAARPRGAAGPAGGIA